MSCLLLRSSVHANSSPQSHQWSLARVHSGPVVGVVTHRGGGGCGTLSASGSLSVSLYIGGTTPPGPTTVTTDSGLRRWFLKGLCSVCKEVNARFGSVLIWFLLACWAVYPWGLWWSGGLGTASKYLEPQYILNGSMFAKSVRIGSFSPIRELELAPNVQVFLDSPAIG